MKPFAILFFSLIGLASSAAVPVEIVQLRIIGLTGTHYSVSSQTPSNDSGHIIKIVVGWPLILEQDPLRLQGLQLVNDEDSPLMTNTVGIHCTVSSADGEGDVLLNGGDNMTILKGGKVVEVTRLSCERL